VYSSLINIGFDMPVRARDWRIEPASVQPEWISDSEGSSTLLIRGNITNLLDSMMPLPRIRIIFYAKTQPDKQVGESLLTIKKPLSDKATWSAWHAAVRDNAPVPPRATHSFVIVAEAVPDGTGDFTLSPSAH